MNNKILVFADDLTGANDVGLQFLDLGFSCSSYISNDMLLGDNKSLKYKTDIQVIDTETRLDSPKSAYLKLRNLLKIVKNDNINQYYKKIDSTLRGNIGYEIDACIDELELESVIFVPAFPDTGRVTIYGNHYLNTTLLERTEFAKDILNPVETSFLPDLIKKQSVYKCGLVDLDTINKGVAVIESKINTFRQNKIKIIVLDCKTNENLKVISKVARKLKMICGASALAREIGKDYLNEW